MASSTQIKLISALILMCMVVGAPKGEAAISCGMVSKNLAQCISFLKGGATLSAGCCNGIKTLNTLAATPADRKTACGCLKSSAASIKGIDYSKASELPTKCGVTIGYAISPSTDCSKVN